MCFPQSTRGKQLAAEWDEAFGKLVASGKIRSLFKEWDLMGIYNLD
jgi:hypothetical protein